MENTDVFSVVLLLRGDTTTDEDIDIIRAKSWLAFPIIYALSYP